MPSQPARPSTPSRRVFLLSAALLPLAGCGGRGRSADAPPSPDSGGRTAGPPAPGPRAAHASTARFAELERRYGARLGVYALHTGTGATVTHRADERFAFCSTYKAFVAAAVLHRDPVDRLDRRIAYTADDIDSTSPVTKDHTGTGMTLRQLCDAAVRFSDGTAGNLLMRDLGGPARVTAYLRTLGDTTSRVDRYEPELHRGGPGDPRDTTTPRAAAAGFRALLLGDALPPDRRALLRDWLEHSATGGKRIRAGLPKGWTVADKTGTGNYGRANDVAVVRPPDGGAPLVLALMSERSGHDAPPQEALLADATARVVAALT
ncbi:class A beta-lactamase [Streptomyces sp. URMC 126]|uniref:class A beta-lactamase n=1 Tax=Streptomyces sp. URMC 126 TaxID=3423401 RepID=UPI003F1C198A